MLSSETETRVFSDELPKDLKHTEYEYFAQDRFALSLSAYEAVILTTYALVITMFRDYFVES